VLSELTVN